MVSRNFSFSRRYLIAKFLAVNENTETLFLSIQFSNHVLVIVYYENNTQFSRISLLKLKNKILINGTNKVFWQKRWCRKIRMTVHWLKRQKFAIMREAGLAPRWKVYLGADYTPVPLVPLRLRNYIMNYIFKKLPVKLKYL